jgi:hypothetical protein
MDRMEDYRDHQRQKDGRQKRPGYNVREIECDGGQHQQENRTAGRSPRYGLRPALLLVRLNLRFLRHDFLPNIGF